MSFAIDRTGDPGGHDSSADALIREYAEYVRVQHASCWRCPVVRSGVPIVASMLEWKATHGDGRLEHWTRRDIRDYVLRHLPTTSVGRALFVDAPTCAKDLVYFLSDRGTLAGDDVGVLVDATDEVLYAQTRPVVLAPSEPARTERRSARRKAARSARKRDRRR